MPETPLAGGPLGLVSEPLPKDKADGGVDALASKDQAKPQATDGQFSKSQVDEMISAALSDATKGMVSKEEMELNVGRVRSQYDRARNEERFSWEERDKALQQQIHGLAIKDMDENAKARYERDVYARQVTDLEDRFARAQAELEAQRQTGQYLKALKESFDVDIDNVDLTDLENLSQSAFTAAAKSYQSLKAELADSKKKLSSTSTDTNSSAALKRAPDVVTQAGGTAPSAVTIYDLRKAVSQRLGLDQIISEDRLFELAERPEITGVDMNVVLKAIEAELETPQES